MAIRINLFHEEQNREVQRKRDPLKLGMFAIAFVLGVIVLYHFVKMAESSRLQSQLNSLQQEWSTKEAEMKAAIKAQEDSLNAVNRAEALKKVVEERFLWGGVFQVVMDVVPLEVQLKSFAGTSEAQSDNVTIILEGVAAGNEPRSVAENLRRNLGEKLNELYGTAEVAFTLLENDDLQVVLDEQKLSTARFAIRASLKQSVKTEEKSEAKPAKKK